MRGNAGWMCGVKALIFCSLLRLWIKRKMLFLFNISSSCMRGEEWIGVSGGRACGVEMFAGAFLAGGNSEVQVWN